MPYTIERLGDTLVLMDADGEVSEVVAITTRRAAKRQIAAWLQVYTFDYALALRCLSDSY